MTALEWAWVVGLATSIGILSTAIIANLAGDWRRR